MTAPILTMLVSGKQQIRVEGGSELSQLVNGAIRQAGLRKWERARVRVFAKVEVDKIQSPVRGRDMEVPNEST